MEKYIEETKEYFNNLSKQQFKDLLEEIGLEVEESSNGKGQLVYSDIVDRINFPLTKSVFSNRYNKLNFNNMENMNKFTYGEADDCSGHYLDKPAA